MIPIFDAMGLNANSIHKEEPSLWVKSSVANIVRYVPSGIYFARAKVGGKLIRQSLKTDKISVAQLRLGDLLKEERSRVEARVEAGKGRMTFGNALDLYWKQVEMNASLKPSAKIYRRKCIEALIKSWPGLWKKMSARFSSVIACIGLVAWAKNIQPAFTTIRLARCATCST